MNTFSLMMLFASLLVMTGAIVSALMLKRAYFSKKAISLNKKLPSTTPFGLFIIGFFVATALVFLPLSYMDFDEAAVLADMKAVFAAILSTIGLHTLSSNIASVNASVSQLGIENAIIEGIYSTYFAILHIIGPILTAGLILSFFKEALIYLKLTMHLKSRVYFLSHLNVYSLTIAKSVVTGAKKGERNLIVFSNVDGENNDRELITEATRIGAFLTKRDICSINMTLTKGDIERKLYLVSENENVNIQNAISLTHTLTQNAFCNNLSTRLYVFAKSIESESILDSLGKGNIKIRRINENRCVANKAMLDHPIFKNELNVAYQGRIDKENAVITAKSSLLKELDKKLKDEQSQETISSLNEEIYSAKKAVDTANDNIAQLKKKLNALPKSDVKELNVAIVGLGGYGTELLKTLVYLGQVKGYHINIHAFENGDGEEKIKFIAPELIKLNHTHIDGESDYDIFFHNNTAVTTSGYLEQITKINNLCCVYIALGNDELNIQAAMRTRAALRKSGYILDIPAIYAVVFSQEKTEILNYGSALKTVKNEEYNITFIGSLENNYSVKTLEQNELEQIALDCHLYWMGHYGQSREDATTSFEDYEYYRKSSMAEALYYKVLYLSGITPCKNELAKYEHCRWNAYMRSEGFSLGSQKRFIEKNHPDLIEFEKLSDEAKNKDYVFRDGRLKLNDD